MITDKEKVEKLLTELGVGFTSEDTAILCRANKHTRVVGFTYFYTTFEFYPDGTFLQMGAYE